MKRPFLAGGCIAALLAGACGREAQMPTALNPAIQAAKPAQGLKVTPGQLVFSGIGASATLSLSQYTGSVSVAVSTPACAAVSLKAVQKHQTKFTVTASAVGSCSLTVTDEGTGNVMVPVTVEGPMFGATLAGGLFHACGLDTSGAAWCWGWNSYGQLGSTTNLATITANPTPAPVSGGVTFASLTAGFTHTCGLTPTGAAYCWGGNYAGQLGNPTGSGDLTARITSPVPVDGGHTFIDLQAGNDFTCGLTAAGDLYCWGNNSLGQLGTTTNNISSDPNPTPTLVPGGLVFTAFAAGAAHTCGVSLGTLYCWGDNSQGQLGRPDYIGMGNVPQPTPTAVQGLPEIASVVAANHTCAMTPNGAAWCWGANQGGQLAYATTEPRDPTPREIPGALSFVSMGVGGGHTCGLISGGLLYCWGGNLSGQLGHDVEFGTANPTYAPTQVGGLTLVAIAIRGAQSCGLTASGGALCWGANRYGQLGYATNTGSDIGVFTPTAVSGSITFATP